MNKIFSISLLCSTLLLGASNSGAQISSPNGRQLFNTVMPLLDGMYDPMSHLVRVSHPGSYVESAVTRESGYYAYGLLLRDGPGDRNKAEACLNAIVGLQYTDPSKRWYGTFKVASTDPMPPGTGTSLSA